MRSTATTRLVIAREVGHRVRSKAFAISTIAICVGIIVVGVLGRVLGGDDGPTRYDVATVGTPPEGFEDATAELAKSVGIEVRFTPTASRAAAEQQLDDDEIDVAVDVDAGALIADDEPSDRLATVLDAAWQSATSRRAAADLGLDAEAIRSILSPARLEPVRIDLEPGDEEDGLATGVGMTSAVLLFVSITAFGGMVLTGVVEEKTTGVVEVLLGHVRAHQLLTGKVLGIGVVALLQFAAAVAAGVVSLQISGTSVPTAVWVGLPASILWFVGGFVLYSTLFALAGSCVSRQEDAQGAASPISLTITAAYLGMFALAGDPSSAAARIVSVLPPFAPLLMPLRVAVGSASVVELILAIVGLVVATVAMLRFAGSVYGRTLLHRGTRLTWRQALRLRSDG